MKLNVRLMGKAHGPKDEHLRKFKELFKIFRFWISTWVIWKKTKNKKTYKKNYYSVYKNFKC
jgi:hypothetical protein